MRFAFPRSMLSLFLVLVAGCGGATDDTGTSQTTGGSGASGAAGAQAGAAGSSAGAAGASGTAGQGGAAAGTGGASGAGGTGKAGAGGAGSGGKAGTGGSAGSSGKAGTGGGAGSGGKAGTGGGAGSGGKAGAAGGGAGGTGGAAGGGGGTMAGAPLCEMPVCGSDPSCPTVMPPLDQACSAAGVCNYCGVAGTVAIGCVFGDHWEQVAAACVDLAFCDEMSKLQLSSPGVDAGPDAAWSPGESAVVSVVMTNTSAKDNFDYPSVTFSSDHPGVTTGAAQDSLFGIVAGGAMTLSATFQAAASVPAGTVVKLTATVSTLGDHACPSWQTVSFDVTLK